MRSKDPKRKYSRLFSCIAGSALMSTLAGLDCYFNGLHVAPSVAVAAVFGVLTWVALRRL